MEIFEKRCKIKDIYRTRKAIEHIGGVYKGNYFCTDIVFKSEKVDIEKGNIILRVFDINNRNAKKFIIVQKVAEWDGNIKTDSIIIKERFDDIGEIINFIIDHYGTSIRADYKYFRKGWEYALDKNRIFVEYIENIGPTIEIESDNKNDLEDLFKHFEIIEYFSEPVSDVMRKLLGK